MKKLFCLLFFILLLFMAAGCGEGRSGDECLSYQAKAFEGEFEVNLGELTFTAIVSGGEWQPESGSKRDIAVEFTAPESLRGIRLERKQEKTSLFLEDMILEDKDGIYGSMAGFADLFELDAVPLDFRVEGKNTRATFARADGDNITLLLGKNGTPLEISDEKTTVKIKYYNIVK